MEEIFCETTRSILKRDKTIDWICGDRSLDLSRNDLLPSWVPDYRYFNFLCNYHDAVYDASRACGTTYFHADDKALTVVGQRVGYIESLRDLVVDKIDKANLHFWF